jgi:hypothetical protein
VKKILLILFVGMPLVAAIGAGVAWSSSVSFREKVLLVGLASGVDEIQRESANSLRDYPSTTSAVALLAFVNLKYRPPLDTRGLEEAFRHPERASDPERERVTKMLARLECPPGAEHPIDPRRLSDAERETIAACMREKYEVFEEEREKDAKVAERGLLSLCVLTGHDFGTYYEKTGTGYSWGSLSDERWGRALGRLNGWAFETFAVDAIGGVLAAAAPAMTAPPEARIELEVVSHDGTEAPVEEPREDAEVIDWSQYGFGPEGE